MPTKCSIHPRGEANGTDQRFSSVLEECHLVGVAVYFRSCSRHSALSEHGPCFVGGYYNERPMTLRLTSQSALKGHQMADTVTQPDLRSAQPRQASSLQDRRSFPSRWSYTYRPSDLLAVHACYDKRSIPYFWLKTFLNEGAP